ncbi:VapC toxin family PIN domain ribonuclease [Aphanothece hegewaldii CCALA 016]|uniref:VapC toxin family PIN domain ribonuclease n=1 Tax=Aphanothece hegewaldii CCALA 016 TaxID=2107694 RepID=A0A2T1LSM4_9CHRO|nr:type II toxin-antitoxin system VapC family toxin [Aphanothece hegewaldii]PSF33047.1 VapC toxin family PIN domain ribonuclease [Aphanothece hegewaldii CCALA 016]
MRYLLDSNTCIIYLKYSNSTIRNRLDSLLSNDVAVCSVVKAELFYGAIKSRKVAENLQAQNNFFSKFVSFPFNDQAAIIYGNIRTQLAIRGTPIGPYDLQIASIAIANNLILVTHNIREFSRIEGLSYEDWEEE